ncbi:FkbM family methyltransferase [Chryseobacterium koreense]|uniref:FkbM family methyltransferase n=1 Tax=Chryseobacterium koreense TaxID=232216 RepID=UPI00065B008E|nr:FkbM family methyltransferase [Chryseobacterium koreense]MBB5331974.1 FkbM family methyltransferase [Chryseobacterium koreense]
MMNKIRSLLQAYKRERHTELTRNLVNPKTGISPAERMRLMSFRSFTESDATFFGKSFYFSHGPSMVHSIDEIFGQEIYSFTTDEEKPYIIDCGANIGLSIYYFKKLYPLAKILAFEPDERIFDILSKNIPSLPNEENVQIKKEAVWTEDTTLEFYSEGALAGSSVTDFGNHNNIIKVNAVDLNKYLEEPVDFLKLDIEGAENKVIFHIKDRLKNVKNLFLEYHGIIGEEQNLGEILNLLKNAGFQYYIRLAGETIEFPFRRENPKNFNQQLNIFAYRK